MVEVKNPPRGEKKSLSPRIITSIVYMIVWALLCTLKWTVPKGNIPGGWGALGFDALFCAISVLGSIEFMNAIGGISFPQRAFTIAFAALVVPLYVVTQVTIELGFLAVACAFAVYVMFLMATSVFDPLRSSVKSTIYCVFCMLYCGVLSTMLATINHLGRNDMAGILTLFLATVFCDSGAYLFGTLFKRWVPWKLSPKLSPNKTIIGAVGAILGGIVGGISAYLMIYYLGGLNGEVIGVGFNDVYLTFTSKAIHPIVTFMLVGLATAVMAMIGDLFESAIKRECGIKDMGKLLPGHGGVLDRFDSMLYCSVVVLLCFGTIIH